MKKKISRKRKKIYTFVVASLGFISGLTLVITLLTLGYFREVNANPSFLVSSSSVGLVLFFLCIWILRKLEVVDDNRSTK